MKSQNSKIRWQSHLEPDGELNVSFTGDWKSGMALPSQKDVRSILSGRKVDRVYFHTKNLGDWDSSFVVFLYNLIQSLSDSGVQVEEEGLPEGVKGLLSLSRAVPEKIRETGEYQKKSFLSRIEEMGASVVFSVKGMLDFLGEFAISSVRVLKGKARFRKVDVVRIIEEAGWKALPIVSLISLLVGLILAFVGALQLKVFGAQIYVADLVSIAMAREMGALMTGIIMAGRTGAAFAANLGTMQVNEEIDALKTLGVSPMDFLIMPRMIALISMMPILCVYSIFMGLVGGSIVGVNVFDISFIQYLEETRTALTFTHLSVGIVKSVLFGFIIAFCGCLQGLNCGRSAAAVGEATTSAVVIAIVYIVVADGILAVVTDFLGV